MTRLITLTFSSIRFSGFDKGLACALKEWKPLADQGHAMGHYLPENNYKKTKVLG
ncbi:MAG: hypothetical protein RPT25_16150 [Cycloclasticus sp.]|jgi:hypothetical protein